MIVGFMNTIPFIASSFFTRTFDEFSRSSEGRWEKHDIIGTKPVLEFVGPDVEEISFKMLLSTTLGVNPLTEIERLQEMRDTGTVFPLVIGNKTVGDNFWTVKSVSHNVTFWDKWGHPLSAEADVTLQEYAVSGGLYGAV